MLVLRCDFFYFVVLQFHLCQIFCLCFIYGYFLPSSPHQKDAPGQMKYKEKHLAVQMSFSSLVSLLVLNSLVFSLLLQRHFWFTYLRLCKSLLNSKQQVISLNKISKHLLIRHIYICTAHFISLDPKALLKYSRTLKLKSILEALILLHFSLI